MKEWSNDDLEFLRGMKISPDPSPIDDVRAARDIITGEGQFTPNKILISQSMARAIIRAYGELTIDTWSAYMNRHRENRKNNGKTDE